MKKKKHTDNTYDYTFYDNVLVELQTFSLSLLYCLDFFKFKQFFNRK